MSTFYFKSFQNETQNGKILTVEAISAEQGQEAELDTRIQISENSDSPSSVQFKWDNGESQTLQFYQAGSQNVHLMYRIGTSGDFIQHQYPIRAGAYGNVKIGMEDTQSGGLVIVGTVDIIALPEDELV